MRRASIRLCLVNLVIVASGVALTLPSATALDAASAQPPPPAAPTLTVGVAPSTLKVRPGYSSTLADRAVLRAGRNEFEAFQVVLRGGAEPTNGVRVAAATPLRGTGGRTIPAGNISLYVERYYTVAVPSNTEGAAGQWPDPLVPDVDTYVGERRNAFPLIVPARQTRAVWVDILVPAGQQPGLYTGSIRVEAGGTPVATIPVELRVGAFTLPSTSTLPSTYGLGWSAPSLAHCPGTAYPFCGDPTGRASNVLRARYLRAGLEHRITLNGISFQPPLGADRAAFDEFVLPYVRGTGASRLRGARFTTVLIEGEPARYPDWIAVARQQSFFSRTFAYPVDEPLGSATAWKRFSTAADSLHAADPQAKIIITSTINEAEDFKADDKVDIFAPVLDQLYGRPGTQFAGNQRARYAAWEKARAGRKVWLYQSCDQHGCGSCKQPSPDPDSTGWPQRVIDSSGVQDRAMQWWNYLLQTHGELYWSASAQLATAWDRDGQCGFSGSGDGTLFYPGTPTRIGGSTDIPIESIRLKLIREGMEDYEYLVQAAAVDQQATRRIALDLFPAPYRSRATPARFEAARAQLFALLDRPQQGAQYS